MSCVTHGMILLQTYIYIYTEYTTSAPPTPPQTLKQRHQTDEHTFTIIQTQRESERETHTQTLLLRWPSINLSCLPLQAANLGVLVLDGDAQALNRDGLLDEDGLVRVDAKLQGLRLFADLGDVLRDGWVREVGDKGRQEARPSGPTRNKARGGEGRLRVIVVVFVVVFVPQDKQRITSERAGGRGYEINGRGGGG